eukprot:1132707-Prorocentrum_lima.AAC.1
MTSSLVGSEMCIRDREMATRAIILSKRIRDALIYWNTSAIQGFTIQPVSYTHLTLPTICSV